MIDPNKSGRRPTTSEVTVMVARKSATVDPAAPVHWSEDATIVGNLLNSADDYVGKVKASKLAMVTDQVGYVIDMLATFRPVYDVAVAEFRGVEGPDAKYPMSSFTTKLTERGKVLRNDQTYAFPITVKMMGTIIFWEGDAEYHESALDAFVAWAGKQHREISFGGYQSWLKGWRDPEGSHYTDDGDYTDRGKAKVAEAQQVADATADKQWCSMDFKLNLSGMPAILQLAWIDAAIHDLEALRARVVKPMATGDKAKAKKLLDTNVDAGQRIGGDRLTTAMANAAAAAPAG